MLRNPSTPWQCHGNVPGRGDIRPDGLGLPHENRHKLNHFLLLVAKGRLMSAHFLDKYHDQRHARVKMKMLAPQSVLLKEPGNQNSQLNLMKHHHHQKKQTSRHREAAPSHKPAFQALPTIVPTLVTSTSQEQQLLTQSEYSWHLFPKHYKAKDIHDNIPLNTPTTGREDHVFSKKTIDDSCSSP